MKVVNPIGKKPIEKADFKAYACVCGTVAPQAAVWGYGHAGCSHCGCACGGGTDNGASNNSTAYSTMYF